MFPKLTLAAAVASMTLAAGAQAEVLTFAHFLPEQFPPNVAEQTFAKTLTEKTGGDLTVEFAWGGVMGGSKEMLDFVANNVVTMAAFPSNFYLSQMPAYEGFGLANGFKDPHQVGDLFRKAYETLPLVRASYDKANVVPFTFRGLDPYILLCNSPVRKLDDLKGLKVRTFGSAVPDMFKALGAVPVSTLSSETYEAMQRGTVDCAYLSRTSHLVFKTYEVSKYYIDFDFGAVASYLDYVNKDVYDGWTDEQRAAFHEADAAGTAAGKAALETLLAKAREVFEANLETMTIEDGDRMNEIFPVRAQIDDYVAQMAALGDEQKAVAEEVRDFLIKELNL